MRYLVTGAAGFIASQVCSGLLAGGHQVVAIDNLNDYYDVRLKLHRLAWLAREAGVAPGQVAAFSPGESTGPAGALPPSLPAGPLVSERFEFHRLDIEDAAKLDLLFARGGFDGVFNLAARAGVRASLEHPELYVATNVGGAVNVLECMRHHGVRKQVLASSSSLYAGGAMPFREDQPVNAPRSPYAATKKAAEMLAHSYHSAHGIDTTVLRYFTVFGPAGRPDMSPFRFIRWIDAGQPIQLFGDGTQTRDFTYVDDIVRGTIRAIDLPGFEIVNLGGGLRPVSLLTVIGWLEEYLGRKAIIAFQPANTADVDATSADIAKAKRLLGWSPEITPEEGFRRTVEWHRENRSWLSTIAH